MGLVTYLPRCLPILFLSGKKFSPLIVSWLRYIPPAILAAMLIPPLISPDKQIDLGFNNLFLWVSVLVIPVSVKSKSLSVTVLLGLALVAIGRHFGLAG